MDDYTNVIAVWQAAGLSVDTYDDSEPRIKQLIDKNAAGCLVAVSEGQILGTVLGTCDGKRAWAYHLAVVPEQQGKGIGTALMQRLIQYFTAEEIKKINLMVLKRQKYFLPFYEQLGFSPKDHVITLEKKLI